MSVPYDNGHIFTPTASPVQMPTSAQLPEPHPTPLNPTAQASIQAPTNFGQMSTAIFDLSAKVDGLITLTKSQGDQIAAQKRELQCVKAENAALRHHNSQCEVTLESNSNVIDQLKSEVAVVRSSNSKYEKNLEVQDALIQELQAAHATLRDNNDERPNEIDTLSESVGHHFGIHKAAIAQLQEVSDNHRSQIAQAQTQLQALLATQSAHSTALGSQHSSVYNLDRLLNTKMDGMVSDITTLTGRVTTMEVDVAAKKDAIASRLDELDLAVKDCRHSSNECALDVKSSVSELKAEVENFESGHESFRGHLKKTFEECFKSLETLRTHHNNMFQTSQVNKASLEELKNAVSVMKKDFSTTLDGGSIVEGEESKMLAISATTWKQLSDHISRNGQRIEDQSKALETFAAQQKETKNGFNGKLGTLENELKFVKGCFMSHPWTKEITSRLDQTDRLAHDTQHFTDDIYLNFEKFRKEQFKKNEQSEDLKDGLQMLRDSLEKLKSDVTSDHDRLNSMDAYVKEGFGEIGAKFRVQRIAAEKARESVSAKEKLVVDGIGEGAVPERSEGTTDPTQGGVNRGGGSALARPAGLRPRFQYIEDDEDCSN